VPTQTVMSPAVITAPTAAPAFNVPMPDLTPETTPVTVLQNMAQKAPSAPNTLTTPRLEKIMETEQQWGRDKENILESNRIQKTSRLNFPST
jgi:hypothetical protein